jgi:hypothetical protein
VTQGIQKRLLRSLELTSIARERPDNLDAFRHELRRRLELLVESILPRGGRLELLVESILPRGGHMELLVESILPRGGRVKLLLEAVVPPVGAILPPVGAILSSGDGVQNRLDPFESLADLTLHAAQYINGSADPLRAAAASRSL